MDYFCKINRYGYSMIVSHHALFSCKDIKPDDFNEKDDKLLNEKYYYWEETLKQFDLYSLHPGLKFFKLFDEEKYPKKRILFDCITMPPYHCGTSEYQKSMFEAFSRLYKDKYEIFLYTNFDADEYHGLSEKYNNVLYPDTISGVFHLGFSPNQLMYYSNQALLNKHCYKTVQTMFDIIMARRFDDAFKADMKKIVDLGVKLSDGIVFISKFTQDDFMTRYINEGFVKDKLYKVIYPSTEFGSPEKNDYDVPFEQYFLIVGNMFEHKVLKETIDAVTISGHNYIIIGYGESDYIFPNVFGYMNGLIDDDYLRYLYSKCKAVIFPSLYEGFGFPIVMALKHNKQIVLNNNALNNELCEQFNRFKDYFSFYDDFNQLNGIVDNLDYSVVSSDIKFDDTWERAATELESFFSEVLSIQYDAELLSERWNMYNIIEVEKIFTYDEMLQKANAFADTVAAELEILYKQFGNYKLLPMIKFAVKKHLKHRFSRLFNLLKR